MPQTFTQEANYAVNSRTIQFCERHGEQHIFIQLVGVNDMWEQVFNRKYCPFCVDAFFQKHFEPLKERKVNDETA